MENKSIHLKGLNGIRAIAALSVVLSHTFLGLEYFGIKKIDGGWNFASYGVTMFFTLSGFLITFLMLKEKKTFNKISIKEFYVRRVLRIWPLYFFYILLVVIVLMLNFPEVLPGSLIYYLCMGANIASVLGISLPFLTHYWSLGVEEQFYFFWPWLVKLFNPIKSVFIFLIFFWIIKLIMRICISESIFYQFICTARFDCMAIGALWAILLDRKNKLFLSVSFNKITQVLCWIVLVLAAIGELCIPDFLNDNVFSIASAIIILNVAFNKKNLINLENIVFNFLGKISYGIYVYHVLIIYILGLLLKGRIEGFNDFLQVVIVVFSVIGSTILVSWASYEFLEKSFLRIKEKYSKILSHS